MTHALDRAAGLAPVIAAHRDETEAGRRVAAPVAEAAKASRLAGMMLAEADGGLETPLPDALSTLEFLAARDVAVSWVLWNSAVACLFARFMDPKLKAEAFATPGALLCQSVRPMGAARLTAEGARVTGRWNLVSGCCDAEWAFLTCLTESDGAREPGMAVVALPQSEIEIIDTWNASGLRGTGSHDVAVADVLAPAHRVFDFGAVREPQGITGRLPVMASISAMFAAQTLGLAQAALDHLVARGRAEVTDTPMPDLRDRPEAQTAVAAHVSALAAARLLLHEQADAAQRAAAAGDPPERATITVLFGAAMHAVAAAGRATADLHALGGTKALYVGSPLERAKRDMDAMRQHIVAQPTMRADVGRAVMGLEPAFPLFWM